LLRDRKDKVKETIINNRRWDVDVAEWLSKSLHFQRFDLTYTLHDAAWILENCQNPEMDKNLWKDKDPEEALCIKAYYSYAADIQVKVEEFLKLLKGFYFNYRSDSKTETKAWQKAWQQFFKQA